MTAPPAAKEARGGRPEHGVEEEQREPRGEEADHRPGEPAHRECEAEVPPRPAAPRRPEELVAYRFIDVYKSAYRRHLRQ